MDAAGGSLLRVRLGFVSVFLAQGPEHSVLIDAGYPFNEQLILRGLAKQGADPDRISLILLTHGHLDHIGSAKALREPASALTAIHKLDADAPRLGRFPRLIPRTWLGSLTSPASNRQRLPAQCTFEPDILIEDGLDLAEYGVAARVIHTPGHTAGSLSIIFADGTAMVGDLIMPAYPMRSRPGLPIYADDVAQVRASVAKVLAHEPRIIYTSHGGPFSTDAVRQNFAR